MTKIPSYVIENPKFESYKTKKRCYYSSLMLSIFLSIFTYILIFYVFEVSPSSIYKNTKVLFFIANALIIIIAADYGSFSDQESTDFYDEYTVAAAAMRSRTDNYYRQQNSGYAEIKNPKDVEIKNTKDVEFKNPEDEELMVKEIVCVLPPEKIVRVVSEEKPRDDVAIEKYKSVTDQTVVSGEACGARKHVSPKQRYRRSISDKPGRGRRVEDTKTRRKSYGRSESDRSKWMVVQEKWENVEEESEEFSKMSNEELNKRVEDFITQFNSQMRSQPRVLFT